MARFLADTNLLLRLSDGASPQNPVAAQALAVLFQSKHEVFITAQNIIEFWAVATRPVAVNELGWSVEQTRVEVQALRERFPFLADSPDIFTEWLRLINANHVAGKRAHDARIVAVLKVNGLDHLLTFNAPDFAGFPSLSIVTPQSLISKQS
jgi:predicted nucleic acid-binding protein